MFKTSSVKTVFLSMSKSCLERGGERRTNGSMVMGRAAGKRTIVLSEGGREERKRRGERERGERRERRERESAYDIGRVGERN